MLEETLDKLIPIPILPELIASVITAITTSIVIYGIDKLDIFGANKEQKHNFIIETLKNKIDENIEQSSINLIFQNTLTK